MVDLVLASGVAIPVLAHFDMYRQEVRNAGQLISNSHIYGGGDLIISGSLSCIGDTGPNLLNNDTVISGILHVTGGTTASIIDDSLIINNTDADSSTIFGITAAAGHTGGLIVAFGEAPVLVTLEMDGQFHGITPGVALDGATTVDQMNTAISGVPAGVTAHSALTGLGGDDHTQYVVNTPLSNSRNVIQGLSTTIIPLIVSGHAAQSAHVFDILGSTGTKAWFDENAVLFSTIDARSTKITSLANGTLSDDAAAFGQIDPAIDTKITTHNAATDPHTVYVDTTPNTSARNKIQATGVGAIPLTISGVDGSAVHLLDIFGASNSMAYFTNTAVLNVPGVGVRNNKIFDLANGTLSDDAAAFGQLITDHGALTGLDPDDDHGQYTFETPAASNRNVIHNTDAAVIPFTVSGVSSQSAHLIDIVGGTGEKSWFDNNAKLFARGVDVRSQKITNLANGTISSDAMAFGQSSLFILTDPGLSSTRNRIHSNFNVSLLVLSGISSHSVNLMEVIGGTGNKAWFDGNCKMFAPGMDARSAKITSVANGTAAQDAATFGQVKRYFEHTWGNDNFSTAVTSMAMPHHGNNICDVPISRAMTLTNLSVGATHTHGSDPGNWDLQVFLNDSITTTMTINWSTSNGITFVTNGSRSISLSAGDRMNVSVSGVAVDFPDMIVALGYEVDL